MAYHDRMEAAARAEHRARLLEANINPVTGLATDYLNHFNEAIMLLEMVADCPDVIEELLAWRPMSYREHFAQAHLKSRELALAAYNAADPRLRESLDSLSSAMTAVLLATRGALRAGLPAQATGALALRALTCLKPLIARAGAVVNGETAASVPQTVVDHLINATA
jgi:hypothetical protein